MEAGNGIGFIEARCFKGKNEEVIKKTYVNKGGILT